jgi:hypothetical protein
MGRRLEIVSGRLSCQFQGILPFWLLAKCWDDPRSEDPALFHTENSHQDIEMNFHRARFKPASYNCLVQSRQFQTRLVGHGINIVLMMRRLHADVRRVPSCGFVSSFFRLDNRCRQAQSTQFLAAPEAGTASDADQSRIGFAQDSFRLRQCIRYSRRCSRSRNWTHYRLSHAIESHCKDEARDQLFKCMKSEARNLSCDTDIDGKRGIRCGILSLHGVNDRLSSEHQMSL